ncbi:protein sisterless A-like [Glossina fuscipes]|uniref:Protein sisterless A-like n=1 Tax=Glossina fuscipes TaxID=7396 RepID=A0A8U0W9V7_9MUSC|nr:protein sisterless A-like [Glossina fuscipes]
MSNSGNEIEKRLVNEAVEREIERIRFNWKIREANYVENMLEDESKYNESLRRDLRRRDNLSDIKINPDDDFVQQRQKERAKAFRYFRVSRRIKKAKLKYRFQYVTNKLLESTDMLESVHDLIGEAEQKLISQGFSKDKIETLRKYFNVDEGAEILNNIKESYDR